MGNWLSQLFGEEAILFAQQKTRVEASTKDALTPPQTTPDTRILNVDPRSPTANIDRTPIEVNKTPSRGGSVDESPLARGTKDKPRSLHQRIVDKRMAAGGDRDSLTPTTSST